MSFQHGSISFRQFNVIGQTLAAPDEQTLDRLREHAFAPSPIPEEVAYGWGGGEHLYDAAFTFEKNVFAECVLFDLRVDTNKAPGNVVRAYTKMEEAALAAGNPSGFCSKAQRREAKETVARKVEAEQREGKFHKARAIPVLYDMPRGRVLTPASGANLEKLMEIFERTFKCTLAPFTAGTLFHHKLPRVANAKGVDLKPTPFAPSPEGSTTPEYPWAAKAADDQAFLGNEFLLWAMWTAQEGDGPDGVEFLFDRRLELECAYGVGGRHVINGTAPDRLNEVHEALKSGKVPRRAGVTAEIGGEQYEFLFHPEIFGFGSTRLPEVEDAETVRAVVEERIAFIRNLVDGMEGAYAHFLKLRTSREWDGVRDEIGGWIGSAAKVETAGSGGGR